MQADVSHTRVHLYIVGIYYMCVGLLGKPSKNSCFSKWYTLGEELSSAADAMSQPSLFIYHLLVRYTCGFCGL